VERWKNGQIFSALAFAYGLFDHCGWQVAETWVHGVVLFTPSSGDCGDREPDRQTGKMRVETILEIIRFAFRIDPRGPSRFLEKGIFRLAQSFILLLVSLRGMGVYFKKFSSGF
jgi:hypothetical protein